MSDKYEELMEKLRKNNRMSGWTHIDRLMDEAIEAIKTLQQEIEQLKNENKKLQVKLENQKYETLCHIDEVIAKDKEIEKLRDIIIRAYHEIEKYKCLWKSSKPSGCDCPKPTELQDEIEQALGGR